MHSPPAMQNLTCALVK
uniref:Splicing factor U2af large subunit B isoform X1 n=1 Tax=Rhizophora mucronata TaxID=61149 RepID=A0A2P2QQJ8_RHIMU